MADATGLPRGHLIERTLTRLLMRPAAVSAVFPLSANFRFIDFEGESLTGVEWAAGDKVQIKFPGGLLTRTYTPIQWDKTLGSTRFLGFCHGHGIGSEWVRSVVPGDQRHLMGPRSSLNMSDLGLGALLFGDETSFALAAALQGTEHSGNRHRFIFEVNDEEEARSVLNQIGLANALTIERRPDDSHYEALSRTILTACEGSSTYVLSGKAQSIQLVSRTLKGAGIQTRQLRTKAYWAPGKSGLD